jgi:hypothetical protein
MVGGSLRVLRLLPSLKLVAKKNNQSLLLHGVSTSIEIEFTKFQKITTQWPKGQTTINKTYI